MRKWTIKYKKSINCKRPKGFSQKQYCNGKKSNINTRTRKGRKSYKTYKSYKRLPRK